ncbi:MAG: hypothetical protein LBG23_03740 [Endomicrobium sp.]|jgi:hypothetical protein|nr:hypothetical protein [Endomicrobium sp.]
MFLGKDLYDDESQFLRGYQSLVYPTAPVTNTSPAVPLQPVLQPIFENAANPAMQESVASARFTSFNTGGFVALVVLLLQV